MGGLAKKGYCKGGSIKTGGKKVAIGTGLCPQSCQMCKVVLSGPTEVKAGCADRTIKIGGKTCPQAAKEGYCERKTNLGHVGNDICPWSCKRCPKPPGGGGNGVKFNDPKPKKNLGLLLEGATVTEGDEDADDEQEEEDQDGTEDATLNNMDITNVDASTE